MEMLCALSLRYNPSHAQQASGCGSNRESQLCFFKENFMVNLLHQNDSESYKKQERLRNPTSTKSKRDREIQHQQKPRKIQGTT
jgi:hypothetical protein